VTMRFEDPAADFIPAVERVFGAEPRVLRDQYRSDPPLVEAINAIFEPLLAAGETDPNVFRPKYNALRAARREYIRDLDVRITMLGFDFEAGDERFTREAESIADWIAAHKDTDYRRFSILFRRLTHIDAFLDVFDRRGLPYVLPPTRLFLERPAAVDLMAVLRAIAYPIDRGAQISANHSIPIAQSSIDMRRHVDRMRIVWRN